MKHRQLGAGEETVTVLVLEEGEEAIACLRRFASEHAIAAAHLSAIGAFSQCVVGFFEPGMRSYRRIQVPTQAEVLSLLGDVALTPELAPEVHAHVVLGLADGSTRGGHLIAGTVGPTLEVVVAASPEHLRRRYRPELGIALIDPEAV